MRLADLKIGTRLGLGFGTILLLMTVMVATAVTLLTSLGQQTGKMINEVILKERLVTEWRHATELNGTRTLWVAAAAAETDNRGIEADIKRTSARISEIRKELDALIDEPAAKALYDDTGVQRGAYSKAREAVFARRKAGAAEETGALLDSTLKPALATYLDGLRTLSRFFEEQARTTAIEIRMQGERVRVLMLALWAAAICFGLLAMRMTTLSITPPSSAR
jgi:methyl-accepting chemotaxis protein